MSERPLRILIVDDSPEDREAHGRLLLKAGAGKYAVIEAESGEEALRLCQHEAVDCLLVDYTLPDIDGLELLARLRGESGALPVPVIFLTGTGNEAVAVRAMKQGVDDYIVKGQTTADGVSQAIRGAIERAALRRQVERQRQELERQGEALRESEHQLRQAMDAANAGSWKIIPATGELLASDRALQLHGLPPGTPVSHQTALACVHRDDRAALEAALQGTVETGEPFQLEYRAPQPDGSLRWLVSHAERRSDCGQTCVVGLVQDITERKRQEGHAELLMHEVNHRAKNMLAVVQSIARQTLAANPEDFKSRFSDRIQALSLSQDLLINNGWRSVDITALIQSQLAHFTDLIGTRIKLSGPPIWISASAAQTIGMAVHELGTNAGKYGALSNSHGRLEVGWSLERRRGDGEAFEMYWREEGGPSVVPPAKYGFGLTVINRIASEALDAEVSLDFAPTGLSWRLRCPAKEVVEQLGPTARFAFYPIEWPPRRNLRR